MQKINRLSKHLTNLIAAGEVVERPASAVKELIENSMDSGASSVTVEIKNGGVSFIRVTDNGSGIPAEEVETAFLRYATSKIQTEEDLLGIHTMGFRGEALAAIAAVSRTSMFTKTRESGAGASITLEAGVVVEKGEAGCPDGTTIIVRDLFFNTPARHKFLKKDATEAGYIQSVCQRAAMCRPDISFKLIKDGEVALQTPGDASLFSVLYCILGKNVTGELLEISYEYENCRVTGYVSKPAAARRSRTMQYYMVNGRPIRSPLLQSAAEEAFRAKLVTGKYPACFLNILVPEESIDVNVHPAKTEVKFANERNIFETLYYGIKNALTEREQPEKVVLPERETARKAELESAGYTAPLFTDNQRETALPLRSADIFVKDEPRGEEIYKIHKDSTNNHAIIKQASDIKTPETGDIAHPVKTSEPETKTQNLTAQEERHSEPVPCEFNVLGEIFGVYVLISANDRLLIMDKHAAHERMKYEELKANAETCQGQALLDPPVVSLRPEDKAVLLENGELLRQTGFEIDDFGGGSVIVRAIPDIYGQEDAQDALTEIAQMLASGREPVTSKRERLFQTIACKAAIRAGDKSDIIELEALVRAVLADKTLRNCPHGRPVFVALDRAELEKYFKRVV